MLTLYTFCPGLKMLSICSCPSVTPEGLLSALALPFLQHFEYYTRTPVPKSFVWGIAAQNPSLESISVHFTTGDTDNPEPNDNNPVDIDNLAWSAEEKKAFFDKHPRIKALVNLVSIIMSYCCRSWFVQRVPVVTAAEKSRSVC